MDGLNREIGAFDYGKEEAPMEASHLDKNISLIQFRSCRGGT